VSESFQTSIPGWSNSRVYWTDAVAFKYTRDYPGVPATSLGGILSFLETLLVYLEIIATTYHSTIFKTHVFSIYSHLYIYVSVSNSSTSAKNISVRAEWLRQSGRAPSEPSETLRWRITPRLASILRVALHIVLRSPFRHFFLLCWSPILNKHCGVVANCDHTLEWVHWVHACIVIAMGDTGKISPHVPSTLSSRSVGRR